MPLSLVLKVIQNLLASYIQPEFNIKFTIIEPGGIQSEFMPNIMNHLTQTGGIQEDEYTHLYNSYVSDIKENLWA